MHNFDILSHDELDGFVLKYRRVGRVLNLGIEFCESWEVGHVSRVK